MLSRKQKWRRVRCSNRRRGGNTQDKSSKNCFTPCGTGEVEYVGPKYPALKGTSGSGKCDAEDNSDDEVSTRTGAISTWSSFDSVESALEGVETSVDLDEDFKDDLSTELAPPGLSMSPEDCEPLPIEGVNSSNSSNKGVTFEPRVQVFLVTHKSELGTRAKQALWWTGRDAAINKRAWLNHLGQPGCGRQSAGPLSRPRAPSADLDADDDDGDVLAEVARERLSAGNDAAIRGRGDLARQQQSQSVGILGCRCQACQTEGDEYEYSSQVPQDYISYRVSTATAKNARGSGGRYYNPVGGVIDAGGSRRWAARGEWNKTGRHAGSGGDHLGSEEKGSRSFSPASQSSSPLNDADVDVFSKGYFWDR